MKGGKYEKIQRGRRKERLKMGQLTFSIITTY